MTILAAQAPHAGVESAIDLLPVAEQISFLANQLDDLTSLVRVDGPASIHLLDASFSLQRALIDLTAELGGV